MEEVGNFESLFGSIKKTPIGARVVSKKIVFGEMATHLG
jgi:hypothetical protein